MAIATEHQRKKADSHIPIEYILKTIYYNFLMMRERGTVYSVTESYYVQGAILQVHKC